MAKSDAVEEFQIPLTEIVQRKRADPYRNHRDCKKCGLFKTCQSPFMLGRAGIHPDDEVKLKRRSKVLIVGEAPGGEEDDQDCPFVGRSGRLIQDLLRMSKIRAADVWWTNTVTCRPPDNQLKNYPKAVDYCKSGLLAEIESRDPDIVVLAGNVPMKAVIGLERITMMRGKVIHSDQVHEHHLEEWQNKDSRNRAYLPILHPAYVLRDHRDAKDPNSLMYQLKQDITTLKRLYNGEYQKVQKQRPPAKWITNFDRAVRYIRAMQCRPRISYDYETTGLDPYQASAKILCVGFAPMKRHPDRKKYGKRSPWITPSFGVSIPIDHPETPFTPAQIVKLKREIAKFLANKKIEKLAQNHRFEYVWSALHLNQEPLGRLWDTMTEHYSTDETTASHGLKDMVARFTIYGGYEHELERAKKKAEGDWTKIPLAVLCPYNGMDAWVTAHLESVLWGVITREKQWPVLKTLLNPATRFLGGMEMTGVQVCMRNVNALDEKFNTRINEIDAELRLLKEVQRAQNILRVQKGQKTKVDPKEKAYWDARNAWVEADKLANKRERMVRMAAREKLVDLKGLKLLQRKFLKAKREAEKLERASIRKHRTFMNALESLEVKSYFNFGSWEHVGILLYDVLHIPPGGNIKDKAERSTDDEVLVKYSRKFKACALLKERRKLSKLQSTYLKPILNGWVLKPDGRIHPNVAPFTRTGRLSSGGKDRGKSGETAKSFKYNIQNLARGYGIRTIFQTRYQCEKHAPTAQSGCPDCGRIVAADYVGLEFVILGILAGDKVVIDTVKRRQKLEQKLERLEAETGKSADQLLEEREDLRIEKARADFHCVSAGMLFGKKPEDVTTKKDPVTNEDSERQKAKSALSFGVAYGRGAGALSEEMGISVKAAQRIIDKFFAGYWGIRKWLDKTLAYARRDKRVVSMLGRVRRLPDINSPSGKERSHAQNEAVNFPIQSLASDFTLMAGMKLDAFFREFGMRARVIALVHDAVYVDAPAEEVAKVKKMVKMVMEAIPRKYRWMVAPLLAEVKTSVTMEEEKEVFKKEVKKAA